MASETCDAETVFGDSSSDTLSFSLDGTLHLHGLSTTVLTNEETSVLKSATAQEMNEAISSSLQAITKNDVTILETNWATSKISFPNWKSSGGDEQRSLYGVVAVAVRISLPISLLEERNIHPTDVSSFAELVKSYCKRTMKDSSLFLGKLKFLSNKKGSFSFTEIHAVEFINLVSSFEEIEETESPYFLASVICVISLPFVFVGIIVQRYPYFHSEINDRKYVRDKEILPSSIDYSIRYQSVDLPNTILTSNIHQILDRRKLEVI
jgi:hypothetical protein